MMGGMTPNLTLFSGANARACLGASQYAYANPCSLVSDLAHGVMIEREDARILAWRGSVSMQDWITDFSAWRVSAECGVGGAEVHAGFWKALNSVRDQVLALAQSGTKPLFIAGHSLGGAMAVLAAELLVRAGVAVAGVYTFGGPRVGNRAWAKAYSQLQIGDLRSQSEQGVTTLGRITFRLINACDIVPRVPLLPLLSIKGLWAAVRRPVSTLKTLGYRHGGRAVFLPAIGAMETDPPLWFLLLSDAAGIYREWSQGRVALLADHAIERYQERVQGV
jgi:Lipase (class 3)